TGSVLIEYQPGLVDADLIIRRVAAAAGLDPPHDTEAPTRRREPAIVAVEAARELNEIVYELTGFRADMRTLVPAGLAALAVYSLAYSKEGRLPRWDNLLYWSYNTFSQLHRREIEGPVTMGPQAARSPGGLAPQALDPSAPPKPRQ